MSALQEDGDRDPDGGQSSVTPADHGALLVDLGESDEHERLGVERANRGTGARWRRGAVVCERAGRKAKRVRAPPSAPPCEAGIAFSPKGVCVPLIGAYSRYESFSSGCSAEAIRST